MASTHSWSLYAFGSFRSGGSLKHFQAGLFSAVVTAFAVEAYGQLQPDPVEENGRILLQISKQLADLNDASVASDSVEFRPSARAIRVNTYWFLSISISLSAALIGLMCKQWVRQYERDASLPPMECIRLRQLRYGGFQQWCVFEIHGALPVLLQIAVILFFVGLLDKLWGTNRTVAVWVTLIVGLLFSFIVLTMVLPVFYYASGLTAGRLYPCPYKTPQAFAMLNFIYSLKRLFGALIRRAFGVGAFKHLRQSRPASWLLIERAAVVSQRNIFMYRAVLSIKDIFGNNPSISAHLFHCLHDPAFEIDVPQTLSYFPGPPLPRPVLNWRLLRDLQVLEACPDTAVELTLRAANEYSFLVHSPDDKQVGSPLIHLSKLLVTAAKKADAFKASVLRPGQLSMSSSPFSVAYGVFRDRAANPFVYRRYAPKETYPYGRTDGCFRMLVDFSAPL